MCSNSFTTDFIFFYLKIKEPHFAVDGYGYCSVYDHMPVCTHLYKTM